MCTTYTKVLSKISSFSIFRINSLLLLVLILKNPTHSGVSQTIFVSLFVCFSRGESCSWFSECVLVPRKGANANVQGSKGDTALILSSEEGFIEVVDLLLDAGQCT